MKKTSLNIFCSTLAQLVTIASGLIVPRLMLSTFGSEVNGLISSLTQFLNYIALVEGGLGSVVLASLYLPLAEKDELKLCRVLKSAEVFFKQIAIIFAVYVIILSIVYPLLVDSPLSFIGTASLTVILAISLFIQYFFSITYRLLLQADQKMYIVQLVQIVATLLNLAIVVILINIWPEVHIVRLGCSLVFVLQPIIFFSYVSNHYKIKRDVDFDKNALSQRWAGFGQHCAYFIHNNTDIVVLSVFSGLKAVSIYSVYYLVIKHLKSFFMSFSHAFAPVIGKAIAQNNLKDANKTLDLYEFIVSSCATIVFGCCMYLLPSFAVLYTKGVNDADYYQPIFSYLIVLAEFVFCFRYPYNDAIYAAGKFKETANSGYIEALINIVISIVLVNRFGLIGIAIGTLTGMVYRMIYFVWYLSKNVLFRNPCKCIKRLAMCSSVMIVSQIIVKLFDHVDVHSVISWISKASLCLGVFLIVTFILNIIFEREKTILIIQRVSRRRKVK